MRCLFARKLPVAQIRVTQTTGPSTPTITANPIRSPAADAQTDAMSNCIAQPPSRSTHVAPHVPTLGRHCRRSSWSHQTCHAALIPPCVCDSLIGKRNRHPLHPKTTRLSSLTRLIGKPPDNCTNKPPDIGFPDRLPKSASNGPDFTIRQSSTAPRDHSARRYRQNSNAEAILAFCAHQNESSC